MAREETESGDKRFYLEAVLMEIREDLSQPCLAKAEAQFREKLSRLQGSEQEPLQTASSTPVRADSAPEMSEALRNLEPVLPGGEGSAL